MPPGTSGVGTAEGRSSAGLQPWGRSEVRQELGQDLGSGPVRVTRVRRSQDLQAGPW